MYTYDRRIAHRTLATFEFPNPDAAADFMEDANITGVLKHRVVEVQAVDEELGQTLDEVRRIAKKHRGHEVR